MKRILSLLLLSTLLFTFVACGGNTANGDESTASTTEAPATEAPTTEAATEAATEAPTTEAATTEAATTEAATTEAPTTEAPTEEPTTEEPKEDKFVYKHVIIVGIDGMGAYHLQDKASTPNLDRIFADYALTDVAQTYNPVASGPCWTSMFTGVDPRVMKLAVNPYDDDTYNQKKYVEAVEKYSTIFHQVKEAYPEANVASVSRWVLLQDLLFGDSDINQKFTPTQWTTAEELHYSLEHIEKMDPNGINLAYFYFCEPDSTGHVSEWGSDAFHAKLTEVDAAMGDIFDALEAKGMLEDTLFIVTTDHGGKGTKHGHIYEPEALTITLGFRGKTVSNIKDFDMLFRDVAPIVLEAMGVEPLESWAKLSAPPAIPEGLFID